MSTDKKNVFDPEDPRFTAYALGELEEAERAEIEAVLANDGEAQQFVADVRATAALLEHELSGEAGGESLEPDQRRAIEERLGDTLVPQAPRAQGGQVLAFRKLAIAAGVIFAVGAFALVLNNMNIGGREGRVEEALFGQRSQEVATAPDAYRGPGDTVPTDSAARRSESGVALREKEELKALASSAEPVGGQLREDSLSDKLAFDANGRQAPAETLGLEAEGAPPVVVSTPSLRASERDVQLLAKTGYAGDPTSADEFRAETRVPEQQQLLLNDLGYTERTAGDDARNYRMVVGKDARKKTGPGSPGPAAPASGAAPAPARGVEGSARVQLEALGYTTVDRDDSITLGDDSEELSREAYESLNENPFFKTADEALSTFSIDVDTASYANVRRFLDDGKLPPPDAVRIEELVNYFSYNWPEPVGTDPFAVTTEVAGCPWNEDHLLMAVGLKARSIPSDQRPPSNLVFLLDVSGSMNNAKKLPLVKEGMQLLADNLTARDRVAIVVYAGSSGLVLPSTPGTDRQAIKGALERLKAGGSTNGGAGIELAYKTAADHFIEGGTNRVILCTDGDFNVGVSDEGSLVRLVEEKKEKGIFLTILGVGSGNLQDDRMETLSNKGDGNYAYIDSIAEARKVLVEEIGGTLVTVAKDVKIQLEFNPMEVEGFRLIGYENRVMAHRDFRDDTKDAGEIGAGHTVTALYEVVPKGVGMDTPSVPESRYQADTQPTDEALSGELLVARLRYKEPAGTTGIEMAVPVHRSEIRGFDEASVDLKHAAAVAGFGMLLRGSEHKGDLTYEGAVELARAGLGPESSSYRLQFISLVEAAQALAKN